MNGAVHLGELARQVRSDTIELLRAAPDGWLCWSPPGTANQILWHAGHAVWLQDALCISRLAGGSELPPGWAETFGMNSRPALVSQWPDRDDIIRQLSEQLVRMLLLLEENETRLGQLGPSAPRGWELVRGILHGLHDEARHQGEMYLLLKLRKRQG